MNINEKMKNRIDAMGIKQSYVADKSKISQNTLSKILRGERKLTADEFLRICIAIDIDPNEFRTTA